MFDLRNWILYAVFGVLIGATILIGIERQGAGGCKCSGEACQCEAGGCECDSKAVLEKLDHIHTHLEFIGKRGNVGATPPSE